MTPLLGTKNPSAPVGDKSVGDRRSARSLLSCALWRGMGRLWRGMGGMGRPEPLPAHRPHQQEGLSGFHGSRDTNHGLFAVLFDVGAHGSHRQEPSPGHGFPVHHCSPLFTIVRHCSAKNITPEPVAPLRPHRQRGLYGSSRVTKLGFPFPCGGSKESNPKPDQQVFTNHETRITNHGFFSNHGFCCGAAMARHERHIASAPFAASHAALRPVPPRRTPNEPMPRQTNVLDCANKSTSYMTTTPDRTASLHFSPRGEAKCVRGASGRGASRLARAGVLDRTLSTASKRNEVLAVVSCASTVGW